ncbi:selenoprotein O2 isoform X2 [Poecilia reticulata]|uniref:selenoprotein O2 isoform X2 n=1 Tax=Poecilia reticulata TaxID=8081 RepID=UPI0007EAD584|nr:PREDICTED: NACHT, LRR and PYD domains-containing protein 3-like isoform X2 [Poecilia reticulata]
MRTAKLVAQWQCVGFCHGVLNTDNMSILGLTLDYGPFGFMDRFDPDFVCNASDKRRRYSYQAQPSVCRWNLARLAEALGSELKAADAGAVLDDFMPTYEAYYLCGMRKKLGLVRKEEAEDREVVSELLRVMHNTGADFTNTFRLLSRVPWPEGGDDERATVGPVVDLILKQCASIEELKHFGKQSYQDNVELAMILSMAHTNPVMFGMVADRPDVAQQLELMGRLKELLETDQEELKEKQRDDWIRWICQYRRRLAREFDGTRDLHLVKQQRLRVMNSSNPRVVLRNYIAQNAIQAADKGDFSEVNRILKVLEDPYTDPEPLCQQQDGAGNSSKTSEERDLLAIQERLKSTLKEQCLKVYEGNAGEGQRIYLKEIYTELHVIAGTWGGLSDEREFRQQKSKQMAVEETIKVRDLFKPDQERQIRTVLTQGIPGMGKTVCAQKFTLSWAEGEEHQDITFLFPLPFRELNSFMGGGDSSLMGLLHWFFPQIKPIEKLSDSKVLFIFDGLDESLLPLNFKYNKVLRDETEPAPLDVLITNLITGDLLCNAFVWITCRPAATGKIPRKYIDQWTEIKGFTEDRWQEYFKKRVSDDALSLRIIDHVKSSKSLYVMCQIPIFCWITVTLIKRMLHEDVTGRLPNTLTEMYVYLLLCQTDRMAERHYPMSGDNVCLKLAELAFRQLEQRKQIFYEADLKECHMDINEATTYSGVCTEMFHMEVGRGQKVFNFVHLSIQEFLAAVFVHYSYMHNKENVLLGRLERLSSKLWRKSVFGFHKSAIEKALKSPDGHWDLFLRFLLGLSLKSNQELLYGVLHLEAEGEEDVAKTTQFIKEIINEEPESKLNLFHCLGELRDESLVQEIQGFVSSGRIGSTQLSSAQWSALTFELMTSDTLEETFDLKKYSRSEEGLEKLLVVITSSTHALLNYCNLTENCCPLLASALSSTSSHLTDLDLSNNKLKDSGVQLLSEGLLSPQCKLKSLRLHECKVEGGCCEALAAALNTESTQLRELDLSANDLQHSGVTALSLGLSGCHCKIEMLSLSQCKLGESSCGALASIFNSDSSQLKSLDLSNNNLKDAGVSLLAAGLTSPSCKLEILRLSCCGLTQKSCSCLSSPLSSDSSKVKHLDLSGNSLQGPGFGTLCSGLKSQHCRLETLILKECSLQKCCADIALVLSTNNSHMKKLDLSENDLEDLEVELLSNGIANPNCVLETLSLSFCGVTVKGCAHLASALSSNPSHLRQLDLSYNYLQDSGVDLISDQRDDPLCRLEHLSVDHNEECYLKSTLKNYSCILTFDANTASTSLFLHDGGKQVTWVRESQPYPKHPERFESVSQVLCHQGLTQRHYWEVEWRGRWVDVAVAMRGISRRANSHVSAFGKTDQSWCLFCSEDHYIAEHDSEREEISVPASRSRKVAVYLDWPGGTLSFYRVSSGSLKHLHTFYSNFSEPLYPGFGMEEDDCSVIIRSN